jgi:hypothetical protein
VTNKKVFKTETPEDRLELDVDTDDVETSVDTLEKPFADFDFRRPTRLTSAALISPNSNRKSVLIEAPASPLTSPMAQGPMI